MIAWLTAAAHYSGNATFARVRDELIARHGYAFNAVNARIFWTDDLNASDDELFFLVYLTYAWVMSTGTCRDILHTFISRAGEQSALSERATRAMQLGVERSWRGVEVERLALWNYVFAFFPGAGANSTARASALADAAWQLRTLSADLVAWPVSNAWRGDVAASEAVPGTLRRAVAYDELATPAEWNTNPLVIAGGDGVTFNMPTIFLLPYWLARYAGFLAAPAS